MPQAPDWPRTLSLLSQRIADEFGFAVRMNGEIEAYVQGLESLHYVDDFWQPLVEELEAAGVPLESIGEEEGPEQYEFRLMPQPPLEAATSLEALKNIVITKAQAMGLEASFAARPHADRPGSGLQWHIHLETPSGGRVFLKREDDLSLPLRHVLGGLLHTMPAMMVYFAPSEASYARFAGNPDHVPQTASWGGNNRSVALRLPESVVPLRHIEHRISGADAEPFASAWAVLAGAHWGLAHGADCGPQCYGDANKSSDYARLPADVESARQVHDAAEWLAAYEK